MPCLACSKSERGHNAQGIAGVGALLVLAFTRYGGANLRGNLEDLAAPLIGFVGSCYDWAREKVSGEYPLRGWCCGDWAHVAAAAGAGLERQHVVPAPAVCEMCWGFQDVGQGHGKWEIVAAMAGSRTRGQALSLIHAEFKGCAAALSRLIQCLVCLQCRACVG